jgi:outer membrane receptor protein involved in Fe transport
MLIFTVNVSVEGADRHFAQKHNQADYGEGSNMRTFLGLPRRAKLLGGAAMLVVALSSATAHAQQAAAAATPQTDNTVYDYGEIVVTAQKRVQNINDVGLSVAAISGDAFKARQINSLADIAQAVPGLSFTQSGSNTPVYTLRGVGFYETTLGAYPDVSTYLDEAPLPFPVLTSLTAFDLERVEVLKGPQGTLFGNNATGGAINYIAAKPTSTFQAGGSIGYGRFNAISAEGYVFGRMAARLHLRRQDGEGRDLCRPLPGGLAADRAAAGAARPQWLGRQERSAGRAIYPVSAELPRRAEPGRKLSDL